MLTFFLLTFHFVDIFDPELKQFREDRWKKAFSATSSNGSSGNLSELTRDQEMWNRRAAITIEYIIQASDVAHTMQHWHVYQKWNKRLFVEMYTAFRNGRSDKDPSEGWYNGELW